MHRRIVFFFPEDIKCGEARDGLPGSNTEGRRDGELGQEGLLRPPSPCQLSKREGPNPGLFVTTLGG